MTGSGRYIGAVLLGLMLGLGAYLALMGLARGCDMAYRGRLRPGEVNWGPAGRR